MHRTTGAGNVAGMFVDEVPGISPGTSIEKDFLNSVQEELAGIVESTGVALDGADNGQVLAAITQLITSLALTSSHSVINADYVILDGDGFTDIDVSAGVADRTITLPASATNAGRRLRVRKTDAGVGKVIVAAAGVDTINGTPTWEITEQYGFVALRVSGSMWAVEAQEGSLYRASDVTQRAQNNPVNGTWYNLGAFALTIPEGGIYELRYEMLLSAIDINGVRGTASATLSKANNSEDDKEFTSHFFLYIAGAAESDFIQNVSRTKRLAVVGGTTFYLNSGVSWAGVEFLNVRNDIATSVISARRLA